MIAFVIVEYIALGQPGPRTLARMWAPAPLDVFTDLGLAQFGLIRIVPFIVMRVAAVIILLSWLLELRPARRAIIYGVAIYAICLGAFLLPLGLSLMYFSARSQGSGGIVLLAVGVAPLLHLALVGILAPAAVRAIRGEGLHFTIETLPLWLLAALSTWAWMFLPSKVADLNEISGAMAFALAFVAILLQSVTYGAIALSIPARK